MIDPHTKGSKPPETEFLEPDGSLIIYTNAYKAFLPIRGTISSSLFTYGNNP